MYIDCPWTCLQVMYVPVTGPNGEQGFAPVQMPMQMPQAMPYQHQPAAGGSSAAPVQFVQGPNGFFLPVSAAPSTQAVSTEPVTQPVAAGTNQAAAAQAASEAVSAGPAVASSNPFEPQAAMQPRQWPEHIPALGDAPGTAPAAANAPDGGSPSGPACFFCGRRR